MQWVEIEFTSNKIVSRTKIDV